MLKTNAHSSSTLAILSDNDTPEDPPQSHSPPRGAFSNREPSPAGNVVTRQPSTHGKVDEIPHLQSDACHHGLEYLATINQLNVKQHLHILAVLAHFQTENEFSVTNSEGKKVYSAGESSGCFGRCMLGRLHSFKISIHDNSGNLVMKLHRPLTLRDIQTLEVNDSFGNLIGSIKIEGTDHPKMNVKDSEGNVMLCIELGIDHLNDDVKYEVFSLGGDQVGLITKHWSGHCMECFTNADEFSITFDMGLDVKKKALLFAAVFLINTLFFESNKGCHGGLLCSILCNRYSP